MPKFTGIGSTREGKDVGRAEASILGLEDAFADFLFTSKEAEA